MFFPSVVLALVLAFVAQSHAFIYNLNVVYGSNANQQPNNTVQELTGQNNDINFQFGGKYVWLVPATSDDTFATGFTLAVIRDSITGFSDLAAGAGGSFRYLIATTNTSLAPVTNVALYRTGVAISSPPSGFSGITHDINGGRGKTFLYLIWD